MNKKILALFGVFLLLSGTFISFASSNEVPMAYLIKLNDLIDQYGDGYQYEGGYIEDNVDPIYSMEQLNYLASVGFIDLDEDGQVEMLTIYGGYEGDRAIDIYSLQGESVEKVLSFELPYTNLRESMIYGFVDLDSRYFYKYNRSYGLAGFDGIEKMELYKLNHGKMDLEKVYEYKSDENSNSVILSQAGETKDIQLEEFIEIRNKAIDDSNNQILDVGSGGAGSIVLANELFNHPRAVLDKLSFTSVIKPSNLERVTESFKGEKLDKLQAFINKTYGIINYDENYDDYDSFLALSKFNETNFETDSDEHDKMDVTLANQRTFDIFGKEVSLKSPIRDKKYDFQELEYDWSNFINTNVRIPKEIYRLNDDMYYIIIHDFLYADYGQQEEAYNIYNEYTSDREFLDQFYDINGESFPQIDVLARYPTYMILKENEDSSLGYSLVKSGNSYEFLTDKELEFYTKLEEAEEKIIEEEVNLENDLVEEVNYKKNSNKLIIGGLGLTIGVVILLYFMKKNK